LPDRTNLESLKLKAALDEFSEVGLRRRKHMINKTPTKRRIFDHAGMYFIALILLLLFLLRNR